MVTQHYRWDFIGLSSYDKPTPETSEKVVDGSTYYEADTSKLYIFYKDTWYEKTATGGGGGGGESAVKTLTSADFNWNLTLNSATEPYDCVALWLLEAGTYNKTVASGVPVAVHANPYGIETLGMGTFIVSTINDTSKLITYVTTNSPHWTQQIVNITNGVSQGTEKILTETNVVQVTGTSTTNVMSQKAVTDALADAGGVTVVQAIGDSTTDVMSQNAVSKAIYDSVDSTGGYRPKIGHGTYVSGLKSMAVGDDARASGINSVALGGSASANVNGSIALGYGASASSVGEMNIGTSNTSYGYNNTTYRLIRGVHDGQNAHDAVTVNQVNATIDAINTALSTNISHIGA